MPCLVTGAAGFLGSNLVRALLEHGERVRAMMRPTSEAHTLNGLPLDRVYADLSDRESLEAAFHGVHTVFHTAAYYPRAAIPVERAVSEALQQTTNLIHAAKRAAVRRLVFTSSLTTIGFPSRPGALATEACAFSTSFRDNPYLMSKAAMEDAIIAAARDGLPGVVVNPTAFYGPYDSKPTSGTQILMIAKRLAPAYVDAPVNVIDVRDVAAAMVRAAERGRVGERYIVGNWNTTQKEFSRVIASVAGVAPPMIPVPFAVARYGAKAGDWIFGTLLRRPSPVPGFFVESLRQMQHYDCSKALQELEYPRHPIEGAIRDALSWFRANGLLRA